MYGNNVIPTLRHVVKTEILVNIAYYNVLLELYYNITIRDKENGRETSAMKYHGKILLHQ